MLFAEIYTRLRVVETIFFVKMGIYISITDTHFRKLVHPMAEI